MDAISKLKAELDAKKRKLSEKGTCGTVSAGAKKKTYRTNGQAKQMLQEMRVSVTSASAHMGDGDGPLSPEQAATQAGGAKKLMLTKAEVIKRLRVLRAPITLFGEGDDERLSRLRKLELAAPDEENEGGQKNFLVEEQRRTAERALQGKGEESSDEEELTPEERRAKKMRQLAKLKEAEDKAQEADDKYDKTWSKAISISGFERVRTWVRRLLKEWECDLDELPEDVKRSVQGRNEINTYKQTKSYIKPLLQGLKQRSLDKGVIVNLAEMVRLCRNREYIKAADQYILLAIGKAAWPMGCTMVGIHERAAREKIFSQDVAHVLNDETQRKYIQSFKRLMTYAQNKFPPDSFTQALEPTAIDKHAPTMLKAMGETELSGILSNKFGGATDFSARY
jgi:pre-mRNA-splicing factor 18